MCRNQEILPVSASLFLRYLLFANLLRLWDTLHVGAYMQSIRPAGDSPPPCRSNNHLVSGTFPRASGDGIPNLVVLDVV
ncbi:MAG: hypothetical protein J6386_23590 [Candidatus Synoicihabitans palmerolidicus]|nr:hypothetical protein [Candidatus Synoicihabitans palmerolidicus]